MENLQFEDFGCISRLNAKTFRLSCVAGNDAEVCASNGKNCSTIFCVGIELVLGWTLGVVGHISLFGRLKRG